MAGAAVPREADDAIIDAPAPWWLRGNAYTCLLRCPPGLQDAPSFVPDSLRERRTASPYALLMFVDYAESPVGPYRELLFIPGRYRFEDGRTHWTISRIFVSTMDSVVNGRRNWGIPKEQAQFDVQSDVQSGAGLDRIRVSRGGRIFADLQFRRPSWGLPLPVGLTPARWRSLGQHAEGRTFFYTPRIRGVARRARLLDARIDPSEFPDVARAQPVLSLWLPGFGMQFPVADTLEADVPPAG